MLPLYAYHPYAPGIAPARPVPLIWSPVERARLVRLHAQWGVTRDQFADVEVGRLWFVRYLVAAGKVGRG